MSTSSIPRIGMFRNALAADAQHPASHRPEASPGALPTSTGTGGPSMATSERANDELFASRTDGIPSHDVWVRLGDSRRLSSEVRNESLGALAAERLIVLSKQVGRCGG